MKPYRDLPNLPDPMIQLAERRRALLATRRRAGASAENLDRVLLPHAAAKYRIARAVATAPVVLP